MPSDQKSDRQALVHDKFVARWADRYLEITRKFGEARARAWARAFLNSEDIVRVMTELNNRRR